MSNPRVVAWSLVAIQAALLALIVLVPEADHWAVPSAVEVAGRALQAVGLAIGIWGAASLGRGLTPSPLPNGRTELVSRGPYRWVRHPIYTAVLSFMAGTVVFTRSWYAAGALVLLVGLFFWKSWWEERHLAKAFPGYREYARSTGRFVPRMRGEA